MGKTVEVTSQTFQSLVLESAQPVLVDFWATWCPPCKMIAPSLEQISDEYDGRAVVAKINVDENQNLAQKYGIRSIPTLLFFKGGEVADQAVGAMPKEMISQRLDALL